MQYLGLADMREVPLGYDRYVWMCERCLDGIDWSEKNQIKYSVIPKNWESDEEIRNTACYLENVKKIVMDYAVDILNEYHCTSYDVSEWSIILNHWMTLYLFVFYDKYLKLLKVESMNQDYECDLYEVCDGAIALDYADYNSLTRTEEFWLYQYSELYQEHFHFNKIKVRQFKKFEKPPVLYRKKTIGYYKALAYKAFIRGTKLLTQRQDEIVFQESYLPFDFLLDIMKRKPGRITNYVDDYHRFERKKLNSNDVDYTWRNKEHLLPQTGDEFALLMCKLLKKNLPIAYVEDFEYLQKRAFKLYKFAQNPKAVFFANSTSYDEVFKAYLFSIKGKKTIFCDIQHGGNYGIERLPMMQSEYELCDYFYTWGWREAGLPCKCKPMPAAKLLDKRLQNVKKGENILYVSYSFCRRNNLLYKRSLFYDQEKKSEIQFLKEISKPLRDKMIVRLYDIDCGWPVKEEIDKQAPGLRYDEEIDFYKSLEKAELVVLMLWSTTILEALYADKPVLVLHNTSYPEKGAIEDVRELERVGILVRTWDDLRSHLEDIYENVSEWWNKPERQKVIQKIREKYTFMPSNAKEIWINEILCLAERD